jgi:1,4-alpha-glucan branching enzyme
MIEKEYTKTGRSCRVTFTLSADVGAYSASLCGDFNEWDPKANPMKKRKDGGFVVTISLKPGQEYRFRYLVDGERWENDWNADSYQNNPYGTQDSIISV